ncbi:MAG: diacylglycerol kinase family lipid kinase [Candidatus Latescibacterota bacterium]|nr:MAG: diacylglycerol kinase family lipid kinase [Candidatus Latescibacterota bacterium]
MNPSAGRGRGAKLLARYHELLRRYLGPYHHRATTRAGEETELVDRALEHGYRSIIAVGGDGTWGSVADRIIRSQRTDVTLGLLPAGTGNDFGKTIGIRLDSVENVVRGFADGCRRRIDVGRVGSRHFLNVVGFGFDIAVIDDADGFPVLKGDLLYQFCALRQLFRFKGLPIRVSTDTAPPATNTHLMLTISNGNYFGGSFLIAPAAKLDDGLLDTVSILNMGPLARAKIFSRVAKGTHVGHDKVITHQSRRIEIELDHPARYEVDGEVFTMESNTLIVESLPQALSVYVPPG